MRRHLLTRAAMAVLALGLAAGMAQAQEVTAEDSVEAGLAQLGITAPEPGMLNADQILQIENVLNSTDDDAEKVARIERILNGTPEDGMTATQLRDSVSAGLAQLGVDSDKVEGLSLTEAAEIENVLGSTDEDALKVARIEQILALDAVVMSPSTQQLRDSVAAELAMLGMADVPVATLSLAELAQIEDVANTTDRDEVKRDRIQAILMQ